MWPDVRARDGLTYLARTCRVLSKLSRFRSSAGFFGERIRARDDRIVMGVVA